MRRRIATVVLAVAMVFGLAPAALAHTATHFHGGNHFVSFHTDTSVTASAVDLFGCSSIGAFAQRWEEQKHWTRQNSTAPWTYSHKTIVTGSWFIGSC
jgi:hypothetical protein